MSLDLNVRALTPFDHPACAALMRSRDTPVVPAKWEFQLSVGLGYGIDHPSESRLIGAIIVVPFGTDPRSLESQGLCAMSTLLVDREFELIGLGELLLQRGYAASDCSGALLTTQEDYAEYFASLGYRRGNPIFDLAGDWRPRPSDDPGVARPYGPADRDEVSDLLNDVFFHHPSLLHALEGFVAQSAVVRDAEGREERIGDN